MKLYAYYRSSCSYRVRIVLAWKGVAYETLAVNLAPAVEAQRAQAFSAINPLQQVPVLIWQEGDHTFRLTQSVAIVEYLEARFPEPRLLPDDPWQVAKVREAVQVVNSGIQPLQNSRLQSFIRAQAGEQAELAFRLDAIRRGLEVLEKLASEHRGPFFLGSAPTLADVFIVPQLYNARRFGLELHAFPRLLELDGEARRLPAFQAAAPERQPDA